MRNRFESVAPVCSTNFSDFKKLVDVPNNDSGDVWCEQADCVPADFSYKMKNGKNYDHTDYDVIKTSNVKDVKKILKI